jgi:ribokinase
VTPARVAVVGSCNIDLVARCAALPRPGETVLARSFTTIVGGKGANQAIAAGRAGARTAIVGAVGDDAYGDQIRATLRDAGVDVRGLRAVAGPSGTALIFVDDAGENSIVVVSGANGTLTTLNATDLAIVDDADALLFQLEIPIEIIRAAASRSKGLRVLNAAPARPLSRELLADIDLLVVNETEARILAAAGAGADVLLSGLLSLVPRVAMTLGAKGVRYADREGARYLVATPKVTAVDTTAAGDTFTGVLATALAERRSTREALELACAAASLCVETAGASTSIPTRPAIDARWAATYGPSAVPNTR